MLITGFFLLFVACIVYMRTDISISKSSPSYLAKLQWDEVHNYLAYRTYILRVNGLAENCFISACNYFFVIFYSCMMFLIHHGALGA
jgi:hypothetical protein